MGPGASATHFWIPNIPPAVCLTPKRASCPEWAEAQTCGLPGAPLGTEAKKGRFMCQETWGFGLSRGNDGATGARRVRGAAVRDRGGLPRIRARRGGRDAWAPSGASRVAVRESQWERDCAEGSPGPGPGAACGLRWVLSRRWEAVGTAGSPDPALLSSDPAAFGTSARPSTDPQAALRKVG